MRVVRCVLMLMLFCCRCTIVHVNQLFSHSLQTCCQHIHIFREISLFSNNCQNRTAYAVCTCKSPSCKSPQFNNHPPAAHSFTKHSHLPYIAAHLSGQCVSIVAIERCCFAIVVASSNILPTSRFMYAFDVRLFPL